MIDLLTAQQAAEIIGIPAVQLERWSFIGLGPKNSGNKWRPRYDLDDLNTWINGRRRMQSLLRGAWPPE